MLTKRATIEVRTDSLLVGMVTREPTHQQNRTNFGYRAMVLGCLHVLTNTHQSATIYAFSCTAMARYYSHLHRPSAQAPHCPRAPVNATLFEYKQKVAQT